MKRRQLLAGGAAAVATLARAQPAAPATLIEWPALTLLDGAVLPAAAWQGQAAVVVFWATYCPFCKRHNAHVDQLHRRLQGKPARVLGVAVDSDAAGVRRYMTEQRLDFPVTLDDGSLRRRFTSRRVIPMTCLVDSRGRLLQSIPGEMSEDDVLGLERVLLRQTT